MTMVNYEVRIKTKRVGDLVVIETRNNADEVTSTLALDVNTAASMGTTLLNLVSQIRADMKGTTP